MVLDALLDVGDRRQQRHDGAVRGEAHILQRLELQRIRHGQVQLLLEHGHRQNLMLLRQALGHFLQRLLRDRHRRQVDERDAELIGERAGDLDLGREAQADDGFAERSPRFAFCS